MEYLMIELGLLALFFLLQKHYKVTVFKTGKQLILFWLIALAIGITWDWYGITSGHWIYPGSGILGIFIGVIPLEDLIFFFSVPYGILVIYLVLEKSFPSKKRTREKL
ncbi:lycopene cyclase domain-containing protein [Candidatus Woesearchaeota archaeon]|nr:lycopene cyclase domain-containing protein [Candidatus Woesearchaeota archaeon]